MNEFDVVGLYDHNAESYKKIREAFETSDVVGIVHATGTGKSYNALQLAYDNKDKKIVWVVPTNAIIEHIIKSINDNPNLDMSRDFPNLEFKTYPGLISMDDDELSDMDIDLLILDEFHHTGAPVWGRVVNSVIDTHPDMKVFGMTAYTVRDRGTSYERDMALDEGDELFSDNIVSRYDLCDAMIDGVLPKPIYRSSYIKLIDMTSELEQRVQRLTASGRDCSEYVKILSDVKKRLHESPSMGDVVKRNIKKNGKYIYFCPPAKEDGVNDIETIKKQAMSWFRDIASEDDIVFYTSYSDMEDSGKSNREAFYDDLDLDGNNVDGKLRVMFAINQYNEGVHAPNIDGVIMGRGTCSDIVFFEQLGRALSVSSGVKKKIELYSTYSIERLRLMCSGSNINYNYEMTKNDLIEKLVAPIIIDLAGNIDFIRDLEDNLKDRLKELQEKGNGTLIRGPLSDSSFDLDTYEVNLFNILMDLRQKTEMTWDDWYKLAEEYYEEYGDLEVPDRYITKNGDKLGKWIRIQRMAYQNRSLSKEERRGHYAPLADKKVEMLENIGMIWDIFELKWNRMYELARVYCQEHGNLDVPAKFTSENGEKLGVWIFNQRQNYKKGKLSEEKKKKLQSIGMRFDSKVNTLSWNGWYRLAQEYYKEHGDLDVPASFITRNGDKLGGWLHRQKQMFNKNELSIEKIEKLKEIGMQFEKRIFSWNEWYKLACEYHAINGDLNIPLRYKTIDGYKIGAWIQRQRTAYFNIGLPREMWSHGVTPLSDEQVKMLESIGMIWNVADYNWNIMYEKAKEHYSKYGNLNLSRELMDKTLYNWLSTQRRAYRNIGFTKENMKGTNNPLTEEQVKMLESIGMIWDTKRNKSYIEDLCKNNNIDIKKNKDVISHISYVEFKVKLSYLKDNGMRVIDENGLLHEIFSMSSMNMKLKYGVSLEDLVNMYGKEKNK